MKVFISTDKNAIIQRFIYIPMAKTPNLPPYPVDHPNLSSEEESNERALIQAENDNREFNEMNQQFARRVTELQTGINERIVHALTRGMPAHALAGSNIADRVKEERVQAELYRDTQGYETSETELREDPKHYRGSETVRYLDRNWPRRMGTQFARVARGAASMVGFNNIVERRVNLRFGRNRNIMARRQFVVARLHGELNRLGAFQLTTIATELANTAYRLGVAPPAATVPAISAILVSANLTELRHLEDLCNQPPAPIPIVGNVAYRDLMSLVDVDQRISAKIGLKEVYDTEELRSFLDRLEFGRPAIPARAAVPPVIGPPPRPAIRAIPAVPARPVVPRARNLKRTLLNTLEPNSLFPLKNQKPKDNPDGIALTAEVRSRILMFVRIGLAADENEAYSMVRKEIKDIVDNEVANIPRTPEEREAIANLQREVSRIVRQVRQYLTELQTTRLRIVAINATLRTVGLPAAVQSRLHNELTRLSATVAERTGQIQTLAQELEDLFNANQINHQTRWPAPNNAILNALATPNFLRPANRIPDLITQFNAMSSDVAHNIDTVVKPKKAKLTPFQLLQRLMRRDYMREHQLNPKEYNEEANHYATIKAALRVEDVKSVDRMRSANARAAEYINRGLVRRGYDRFKKAISRTQEFVGLEAIDFENMTATRLLEQVINSSPEFRVFTGINKFTTTRDLRFILKKTGKKVPREVVERFAATLEEALNRYKAVVPALDKGLNTEDWDLEQIIEPLKKLKVELWAEELLTQVNASPAERRELAMVQLLRGSREREKQIEDEITKDVEHPDAPWRVQLAKKELKKILNKESLDGLTKIKEAGIEEKKHRITKLEQKLNALPENDTKRVRLQQDITNLRDEINVVENQIAGAADMYEKVKNAREYIKANDLGRRAKREYLASVGLTQVFDKMSQNFRMQDTWAATKRGAKAFWGGTKKVWNWSRKKFLNAKTAKSVGSKTFSVLRLGATPITAPMGWAWKAGTFPFRLVGRAMSRSVDAPWWMAGQVSDTALRRFYRVRAIDEKERLDVLVTKRNKYIKKLDTAPYSWDKKRIADKMNRLEEKIYRINGILNDVRRTAVENKVYLGEMAVYSEVANDNGKIIIVQSSAANDNNQPIAKAA